jgi:hypothetical protein
MEQAPTKLRLAQKSFFFLAILLGDKIWETCIGHAW